MRQKTPSEGGPYAWQLNPGDVIRYVPLHGEHRVMFCLVLRQVEKLHETERQQLEVLMLDDTQPPPHTFEPGTTVIWPRHYLEGSGWERVT